MKNLSKSKIVAFNQCAKRLWLEVHKPEEKQDSAQTLRNYATGNKVGELARRIYDEKEEGTLIDPFTEGWPSALSRTRELIGGDKPIFEATFSGAGVLALTDVMQPVESGAWDMVEVKSSTTVKDYHRLDVAVQMHAAIAAGFELNKISLACIDNTWVYPGRNDYRGLLYETDMTDEARARQAEVSELVQAAQAVVVRNEQPEIEIGPQCKKPFECGFYNYCSRDLIASAHPVSWLPNIRKKTLKEFIADHRITDMALVPDHLLNEQQLLVKRVTLSGETHFDQNGAKSALSFDLWPACFLDFETINLAIPIWKGTKPYEQIPYQFSNHIVSEPGEIQHREFLNLSGDDSRRNIALELIDSCGDRGPIYVYNLSFEKGVIQRLALQFDDLADNLNVLIDRLVDLLPIAQQYYYHPSQEGSWSIKKVLPSIAPDLHYTDLQGVQDGGMAMGAFEEAIKPETSPDRKSEIEKELLKYCELDTYAMVTIWRFFAGWDRTV
jgi:hypothetical protein